MYEEERNSGPPIKRFRNDDPNVDPINPDPSIVVHVRNLNHKATEADLLEALGPFGPIAYALVRRAQSMALVEFETLDGAKACVEFAGSNQIFVAGQPAQFNYSTSESIQRMGHESATPNHVLVLTVTNVQYPITADVIHEICNSHGDVKRICIVKRTHVVVALVEFESQDVAKAVKHAINGADIYSGCCTLKVEFAGTTHVRVTRQDNDQRDYTGSLDVVVPSQRKTLIPAPSEPPASYGQQSDYPAAYPSAPTFPSRNSFRGGPPPGPTSSRPSYPPNDPYTRDPYSSREPYDSYSSRDNNYDRGYSSSTDRGYRSDDRGLDGGDGCVIMVYGLDQAKINCDMLFNLFCQYGNVLRVKFMLAKVDTAMVEMGLPEHVTNVMGYLQGVTLFGMTIELKPSFQAGVREVKEPFDMPDGTPSFKDFTNSRNQRFSTAEAALRNRLTVPTRVIHWYNAPPEMDGQKILDLFAERGAPLPASTFVFPSRTERSSSGTAEFDSLEKATEALSLANHTPVPSPAGKSPYIVKMAFTHPRSRNPGSDDHTDPGNDVHDSYDDMGEGGYRGSFDRASSDRPSSYRAPRGRGRGGDYRGGSRGGGNGGGYRGNSRSDYRGGGRGRGRGRMSEQDVKELIKCRDKIDAEIEEHLKVLELNNCTMDTPLVDEEGFPIAQLDVHGIRIARNAIILLRNDRKELMDKIAEGLITNTKLGATSDAMEVDKSNDSTASVPNVHRTSNEAFAKVTTVTADSPAALDGFKVGDLIIQYGPLHHGNFKDMAQFSEVTRENEGKMVRITVIRDGRPFRLELHPRTWSGKGLLGCGIVPESTVNIL
ncbi:unnamed protein product [Auanema sp. JU1783]|nr:unnamed protein product [Auanema sp. JU1783]